MASSDEDAIRDLLDQLIIQRGGEHGNFGDNARLVQVQREWLRSTPNWDKLSLTQQTALDEIALKMARILSQGSNPEFIELQRGKE